MEILDWVKKQTGKIADNVKDYKFYVKHEPNFIDSSTNLTLTTYANRDQIATIPCIYKWSKIKNGLTHEIPEFKGNSFICEPSHVGSIIQAEVTVIIMLIIRVLINNIQAQLYLNLGQLNLMF